MSLSVLSCEICRNELAGAAFRFGHSSIDGFFTVVKDNGQSDFIDLKENFFNSDLIYKDGKKTLVILGGLYHGYNVTIAAQH